MPASTMCFHLPTRSLSKVHAIPQPSPPITETPTQLPWPKWLGRYLGSPALPVALLTPRELKARGSMHYLPLPTLLSRAQRAIFPPPCPRPPSTTAGKYNQGSAFFNRVFGAAVLALTGGLLEILLTWASIIRLLQHLFCEQSSQTTPVTLQLPCRAALQQIGFWQPDLS